VLERKELHLYTLTEIPGSRDVFAMVAHRTAYRDKIIGQQFLLPLIEGESYFEVCLRIFQNIASGIDVEALKKYIEPIVEKRMKEHIKDDDSKVDNDESKPQDDNQEGQVGSDNDTTSTTDYEFYPDDRSWGDDIFPGVPNRHLLIAVDSVFSFCVIDEWGKEIYTPVKGDGNATAFPKRNSVIYVKILLSSGAFDAKVYSDDQIVKNTVVSDISLNEEVENGVITLDKCLDLFTSPETLGDDDLWRCRKCKDLRKASRQSFFWSVPPLLIVHLKRFSSCSGYMGGKISDPVDFPIKGLDMTKRVLHNPDGKPLLYDLYAVSNHFGGLGGGHYTAYAMVGDEWYYFDDSHVSRVSSPEDSKKDAAYVLFYKLRGWEAPTFDDVRSASSVFKPDVTDVKPDAVENASSDIKSDVVENASSDVKTDVVGNASSDVMSDVVGNASSDVMSDVVEKA